MDVRQVVAGDRLGRPRDLEAVVARRGPGGEDHLVGGEGGDCLGVDERVQPDLDREFFEKVLLNLMLNAEDAMPDGGTLTLQARGEGAAVVLDVIDTGGGIPPETMARLFKPFHTTKPDGNGLGLATARRIVLAHGGTIEAQSEVGRGTKFTIRLPGV